MPKEETMLVLTRMKGERINIGNDIMITLIEIRGDKARIGIDAPPEIRVDREEVALRRARTTDQRNG